MFSPINNYVGVGTYPILSILTVANVSAADVSELAKANCPNCVPYKPKSARPESNIATISGAARALFKVIPSQDLRKGVTTYLEIIAPEKFDSDEHLGTNNIGIIKHLDRQFSNPENKCLRKAAIDFYREVKVLDQELRTCGPKVAKDQSEMCKKPSLERASGEGLDSNKEPGWIWNLAMKHSGQNPNIAMKLIGLCGNDDTANARINYYDRSPQAMVDAENKIKEEHAQNKIRLEDLEKADPKLFTQASKSEILASVKKYMPSLEDLQQKLVQVRKNGAMRELDCPGTHTDFYLSGSLGKGADIPADLKKKIIEVQSRGSTQASIPSKYYHVYGGALMACAMIENGVSPERAVQLEVLGSRIYRAVRICDTSNSLQERSKELLTSYQKQQPAGGVEGLRKKVLEVAGLMDTQPEFCQKAQSFEAEVCHEIGFNKERPSGSYHRERAQFALMRFDTAALFQKWYAGGGSIMGNKIPCTDIRLGGPKDLMNPRTRFLDRLSTPEGWDEERFTKASKHLATWQVDFDWTREQHKAGAEFAAKNCKPDGSVKPLKCENAEDYILIQKGVADKPEAADGVE